jgi:hypothetical protein
MEGNKNIEIQHPEAWELLVSIGDKHVDYMLYTPTVPNSLIVGDVAWSDGTLQGLEDAIYDTPVLLGDYRRVRLLVDSRHFVLFPDNTDDDDCIALLHHAFPADDGDAAVCALALNGVKIAYLMPKGMQAFLGRTFNYPMSSHHLAPLCEHLKGQDDGVSGMFLNLQADRMDLVIYRDGALQCANSYPYTNVEDATYYALSAGRAHGLDQMEDELQIMGVGEMCAAMTPELRKYVKQVMPAVFPAPAMQLGRNAVQAPMNLLMLALCE